MGTLYDLTVEYESVIRDIMEAESGEDIAALTARLNAVGDEWTVKAGNLARVMRELVLNAESIDKEIKRLAARKTNCETGVKRIKEVVMTNMQTLGLTKVNTDIGRWSIRKNPLSVEIIDEDKIPDVYMVHPKPTVSKTAILEAYKQDGELVPGTEIKQTESLQFR